MSYEGVVEFICINGHHSAQDAYEDEPKCCPVCKATLAWRHSIDTTNGYEKGNRSTYPGRKRRIGSDPTRKHRDRHGNSWSPWSHKTLRYAKVGSEWSAVK